MKHRRDFLRAVGATTALPLTGLSPFALATKVASDSQVTQLFKSLSDEQVEKVCLPVNHKRRHFVSNWWYVHPKHRVTNTFTPDQQEQIGKIFDSLHHPEHEKNIRDQVKNDQYGDADNAPSVGFFGTPEDEDFGFIYTGHHVTRRCNGHTDAGTGFNGEPVFYGHFAEKFRETKDHPGNPYWYQGLLFNKFVQGLDGKQQEKALISGKPPRSEKPDAVVQARNKDWPGLACRDLSADQQELFIETMRKMLVMFRKGDVDATIKTIRDRKMVESLHVSWYDGKYDIGSDKVWDTWQIEGPDMVWYFRGQPHIHAYLQVNEA